MTEIMKPREAFRLNLSDFDYHLPPERIAQFNNEYELTRDLDIQGVRKAFRREKVDGRRIPRRGPGGERQEGADYGESCKCPHISCFQAIPLGAGIE